MRVVRLSSWLLAIGAAAVVTAACGSGSTALHPTSPTPTFGASALSMDEAADLAAVASAADTFDALGRGGNGDGRGHGEDNKRGKGKDKEKNRDSAEADDDDDDGNDDEGEEDDDANDGPGRQDRRMLSGFVTAVGADTMTIGGAIVRITDDTVIRHGHRRLSLDDVHVGDHAQARGMYDGAVLVATEVKVEDTGRDNDGEDEETELKGTVTGLTASPACPSVTFTIGSTTVKTNAVTTFDDVTCAALANGNVVEVEGVIQTDGSLLASKVELESGPNEVEGRIAGLSGTSGCPALTFTVGTTTVTTSSTTTYTGVTCATLANNMKVEVEGTLSGTTLAAAKVELDD